MATYSAVGAGEKDADSPITVGLIDKLDQNPHAIAEGASGAPKIQTAAIADEAVTTAKLKGPTAGTGNIIYRLVGQTGVATTSQAYEDAGTWMRSNKSISLTVLVSGTITCYLEHHDILNDTDVRIMKNNALIQEWSHGDNTWKTRQVDVSVSVGDLIVFQQKASGGGSAQSEWRNVRVYSNTADMAVA